jgi:hypothetical protein
VSSFFAIHCFEEGGYHNGREGARPDFVVTDTVGFIQKLPTQLL